MYLFRLPDEHRTTDIWTVGALYERPFLRESTTGKFFGSLLVHERFLPSQDLVADPLVRLFHPITQADGRFPMELFQDQRVVAIASADALRCIEVVFSLELHPGDVLGNIH